jgi:hypothetical protein
MRMVRAEVAALVGDCAARVEHDVADTASQAAASALTVRGEPRSGF